MIITRLAKRLKIHEGEVKTGGRHRMYTASVGKITIGYGRNLSDRGLSDSEAAFLLNNDMADVVEECRREFQWFDKLDDVRQEVILNMVFNLGMPKFKKFKKTITYIEQRNFTMASEEMLNSKWARQVGSRALELSHEMQFGLIEV